MKAAAQQMDQEASTIVDGFPTGFYWYGAFATPAAKKKQTEVHWNRRFGELLPRSGFDSINNVVYPGTRKRCDLVLRNGNERIWLEVKCADRVYWKGKGIYYQYLYGDPSKSHSSTDDLHKLGMLTQEHADFIGLAVFGFDHPDDPMERDIQTFAHRRELEAPRWLFHHDVWIDRYRAPQRTHVYLWIGQVS